MPKYFATVWCSRWQWGAWLHVYRHTIYFFMCTSSMCSRTGSPSWATMITITLYSDIWYHQGKPLGGGGSESKHLRDFSLTWPTWLHCKASCNINSLPHKVVHVCTCTCIYVRTSEVQYTLQYIHAIWESHGSRNQFVPHLATKQNVQTPRYIDHGTLHEYSHCSPWRDCIT